MQDVSLRGTSSKMVQCKACCCVAQHQLSTHYAVLGYKGIGPGLANLVMQNNNVENQVALKCCLCNRAGRKVVTKPSSRFGGVFVLCCRSDMLKILKLVWFGMAWLEIVCSCAKLRRRKYCQTFRISDFKKLNLGQDRSQPKCVCEDNQV